MTSEDERSFAINPVAIMSRLVAISMIPWRGIGGKYVVSSQESADRMGCVAW